MKRLIPGFFILIFMAACSQKKTPAGILESGKMINVLTDIHLVDSYLASSAYDTTVQPASKFYSVVFRKHGIDSLAFRKSLKYYSRQPEVLDTMYYDVLNRLERLEQLENLRAQRKLKSLREEEVQKQNANIRLKPQAHWFFKYDTNGLFNQFNSPQLLPAVTQ